MIAGSIIVVEDEGITAVDIQTRLERLGYRVPAVASSGPQALEAATKLKPDLLLMDIRLRGPMDGVETAEQIRKSLSIPITFLTAYADDEILERAQATAPYGYLVKPFDERELHATIQMALYRRRIEDQISEASAMLACVNESLMELTPTEERMLRERFAIGVRKASPAAQIKPLLAAVAAGIATNAGERMAVRAMSRLRTLSLEPKHKRRGNGNHKTA